MTRGSNTPLADSALAADAKAANAKMRAAVKEYEAPRSEFFAEQCNVFRGENSEY